MHQVVHLPEVILRCTVSKILKETPLMCLEACLQSTLNLSSVGVGWGGVGWGVGIKDSDKELKLSSVLYVKKLLDLIHLTDL